VDQLDLIPLYALDFIRGISARPFVRDDGIRNRGGRYATTSAWWFGMVGAVTLVA
jgi:hypothetical protein